MALMEVVYDVDEAFMLIMRRSSGYAGSSVFSSLNGFCELINLKNK